MTTQRRSIGVAMRELRNRETCKPVPVHFSERMVDSIRQSMRAAGYEISAEETRVAIQRTLDRRNQEQ